MSKEKVSELSDKEKTFFAECEIIKEQLGGDPVVSKQKEQIKKSEE